MKPASSTRKLWRFAIVCVLVFLAYTFVWPQIAYYRLRQKPAELFVHVEVAPWQSVTIRATSVPSGPEWHFDRTNGEVRVSPIAYGIYRIGIQLTTNQMIWSEYYHCDAGVRRRVDIFVTPSSNHIHFHQTFNQSVNLFDGDVRPEDTSEQKPFQLSWI